MIALLNLVLVLIVVVGVFSSYKLKKAWPILTSLVLCFIYNVLQPSYGFKGEVNRKQLPAFEQSEAVVEDRLLSPKEGKDYDKEREDKIKTGLPFIEK